MGVDRGRGRLRLLLDTHALLWFATDPDRISPATLDAIYSSDAASVSPVSVYELTYKQHCGKLPAATRLLTNLAQYLEDQDFQVLPLSLTHAETAGRLPLTHRDPFDRMLAAQALVEELTIVSIDSALDQYGVRRLW